MHRRYQNNCKHLRRTTLQQDAKNFSCNLLLLSFPFSILLAVLTTHLKFFTAKSISSKRRDSEVCGFWQDALSLKVKVMLNYLNHRKNKWVHLNSVTNINHKIATLKKTCSLFLQQCIILHHHFTKLDWEFLSAKVVLGRNDTSYAEYLKNQKGAYPHKWIKALYMLWSENQILNKTL